MLAREMSSDTYNAWTLGLWVFTLLAGIATIIIYACQLRAMREATRAQNLAWLVQYLQAPDVRHARHIVMTQIRANDAPGTWPPEHREGAATACAAYGVAAVFIELGRVDKKPIVDNWGPSIRKVGKICEGFIAQQRQDNGQEYWRALVALIEGVAEPHPK